MIRYVYIIRLVVVDEVDDDFFDEKKILFINFWEISRLLVLFIDKSFVKLLFGSLFQKSLVKGRSFLELSLVKDIELMRRQVLERKLEDEERKKSELKKKKKKIVF